MKKFNYEAWGYAIGVVGVALILGWIGVFKFTAAEAKGIEPLVKNSFFMSWLYAVAGQQGVSNLIGGIEIMTALCLLAHFIWSKAGIVGGALASVTFLITLSFLFTTPGVFKTVEGVPVTDFFILKDIMALGVSLTVLGKSLARDGV